MMGYYADDPRKEKQMDVGLPKEPAAARAEIPTETQRVAALVERVENLFAEVETRMRPVLLTSTPINVDCQPQKQAETPLGQYLKDQGDRLEALSGFMQNVIQRIQL